MLKDLDESLVDVTSENVLVVVEVDCDELEGSVVVGLI